MEGEKNDRFVAVIESSSLIHLQTVARAALGARVFSRIMGSQPLHNHGVRADREGQRGPGYSGIRLAGVSVVSSNQRK